MSSFFSAFRRLSATAARAAALHEGIVMASRQPVFYTHGGVPDTFDGRFELLTLHAFAVLRVLQPVQPELAQALIDRIFTQFDLNLREQGVGDMGVGKRIKLMAKGFYGRLEAYEQALSQPARLHAALANNLFGTLPAAPSPSHTAAFARYLLSMHLPAQALARGELSFPAFTMEMCDESTAAT